MKARVLVADDHYLVRQGLCDLLDSCGDLEVVGEARNGVEAVQLARDLHPDVVVMDVEMPIMGGMQATREIIAEMPQVQIVGVSSHTEPEVIARMLQAGAQRYVLKSEAMRALPAAVRELLQASVAPLPALP